MKLKNKIRLLAVLVFGLALFAWNLVLAHDATVENVDGSIRFYVEQDGERVKRESGSDLYFQNPLSAAAEAMNRAQNAGKSCVVRERQETCFEVTGDTGGDTGGDTDDGTGSDTGGDTDEDTGNDGADDSGSGSDGGVDDSGSDSGGDVLPENYGRAVYAYYLYADGSLKDPVLLDGALLQRAPVHFGWVGIEDARFYCCKGAGAIHRSVVSGAVYTIDLSELPVGAAIDRELYTDFIMTDGAVKQNNIVHFRVVDPELVAVTLEWEIPNRRENGDALPVEELAGYRVEYQSVPVAGEPLRIPIDGGAVAEYNMDLEPGEYRFRVTAVDAEGLESEPSDWVEGDLSQSSGDVAMLVTLVL